MSNKVQEFGSLVKDIPLHELRFEKIVARRSVGGGVKVEFHINNGRRTSYYLNDDQAKSLADQIQGVLADGESGTETQEGRP